MYEVKFISPHYPAQLAKLLHTWLAFWSSISEHFKQEGQAEEGVHGFAEAVLRYGGSCLVCLMIWHSCGANMETKQKWFSQDFLLPGRQRHEWPRPASYEIPRSLDSLHHGRDTSLFKEAAAVHRVRSKTAKGKSGPAGTAVTMEMWMWKAGTFSFSLLVMYWSAAAALSGVCRFSPQIPPQTEGLQPAAGRVCVCVCVSAHSPPHL